MSQSDTRLFVGRLGRDVRQRDLEDLFNRYGTIKNCSLKSTYGFVEFEDPRDARDALALDGTELEGSRIVVEFSRGRRDRGDPRDRRGGGGGGGGYGDRYDRDGYRDRDRERDRYRDRPPSRFRNTEYRCIIEDLPSGCSWQDLKDHFRTVGDVCFADVRRERGGRDYGIVEFKYEDDLQRAVDELDRSRIRGTQIRVISDYKAGDRRRSRSRDNSRSPRRSPRRSPGGRSPVRSPAGGSPRRDSPRRDSPRRDSPRRDSPRRDSPRRDSPRRASRSPVRGGRSRSASR